MGIESGYLVERKCAQCGRIFCPAPEHAFIEDNKGFCKWSCLCEYRKKKEADRMKKREAYHHRRVYSRDLRERAIHMCESGKTPKEVGDELGINNGTVSNWMAMYKDGRLKL